MNDPLEILKTVQKAELPDLFEQRVSEAIIEKRRQTIPVKRAGWVMALLVIVVMSEVLMVVKVRAEKTDKVLSSMIPSGNDKLYE
ncbi:MAG: hypothetical protein QM534_16610 [Sediminibacterium sp.]|nr:hypothetical protein [Sediminibacterium sp.]